MKRAMDLVLSSVGLLLAGPLLLLIAALVRWRLGTPVLFRQTRPGLGGKPFGIVKFRTMTLECSSDGTLLPEEMRLKRFGRFLRSTSLDELPALINVLRGEMSLVGPRPLLLEYVPLYSERQARRHSVRPGITGWAQVNGRNVVSWPDRLEMDVWYVEHRCFGLDLWILARTVGQVLTRRGISEPGEATRSRFRGDSHVRGLR